MPFIITGASSFSEIGKGGRLLQQSLVEIVSGTSTCILGRNTLEILVRRNKLDTFLTPKDGSPRPSDGGISILSQSGSVLMGVLEMAANEGLGVASCIGPGNKADLNESDVIEYFIDDEYTECAAVYLESFEDGRRFIELRGRLSPRKPVAAAKVGRNEKGMKAVASHTGALARSSDAPITVIFKRSGIIRAYDEMELPDDPKALAYLDHIDGDKVAVVSGAAGFGIIAADYISSGSNGVGMRPSEFSEETRRRIIDCSLYFASAESPIDLTGGTTDEMYDAVIHNLQED